MVKTNNLANNSYNDMIIRRDKSRDFYSEKRLDFGIPSLLHIFDHSLIYRAAKRLAFLSIIIVYIHC